MSAAAPEAPRLYVSSVEGHLVRRFGSGQEIGAEIIPAPRGQKQTIRWLPHVVVALSLDELRQYKREYKRAIAAGALRERTAQDFADYIKAEHEANELIAAERDAARLAAAGEQPTPPTPPAPSDTPTDDADKAEG